MAADASVRSGAAGVTPLVMGAAQFVAEPEALDAWAVRAAPGAACLYARASRLTGGVGERARQMHERGMVQLAQGRDPADRRLFTYRATRTAAPFAPPTPRPTMALSPDDAALLDLLVRAADAGELCPTNRVVAARLGFRTEKAAQHRLVRLRAAGVIRVFYGDDGKTPNGVRVVEIVETGARTLVPAGVVIDG